VKRRQGRKLKQVSFEEEIVRRGGKIYQAIIGFIDKDEINPPGTSGRS